MSINAAALSSGWTLADGFQSGALNNRPGLERTEMANLYFHYKETGQQDQASLLATVLGGGQNNQGYFDLIDVDRDGSVSLQEMSRLGGLSGSANLEASDFQTLAPQRFVAGGVDVNQVEQQVIRPLANDPTFKKNFDTLDQNTQQVGQQAQLANFFAQFLLLFLQLFLGQRQGLFNTASATPGR